MDHQSAILELLGTNVKLILVTTVNVLELSLLISPVPTKVLFPLVTLLFVPLVDLVIISLSLTTVLVPTT